ncbi:MAG: hypothetical protein KJ597_00585 [Nanoarchaeota archaeon]|nr:hypothetical protein [Nanoarchaeota archaeon]MBU1622049.1 hypothetical protein [Nanoarchaeota archaeon]
MGQNRNKLLQLMISNLVNVVVHKILEETVREEILRDHYNKESLVSLEVAKRYREKINPVQRELPDKDIDKIKEEVLRRANQELQLRISKGYQGIDLSLVEKILEKVLWELRIEE